jgi:hypothetical protein
MDTLFDSIYNEIINEEEMEGEVCNICHWKIFDDKIKLPCSHLFHKSCLKKKQSNCPYCNKTYNLYNITTNVKCDKILKTGKNKGNVCGRTNCHYHSKT